MPNSHNSPSFCASPIKIPSIVATSRKTAAAAAAAAMTKKFTGILMGMGNPLLDISANVDPDLLTKYNLKLDTAILAEESHMALYPEMIEKYSVQYIAGGATQNSCRVAQWMLRGQGFPDNTVAFMGCVGANDAYGTQLQTCAEADGVLVHYRKDDDGGAPTGTCAALIVGGERALVANLAAANNFKPSHLETPLAKEIVEAAQFYYCAGFFLTVSVESLVQIAEQQVVPNNKVFCLNFSAPFIVEFYGEQLATALAYADVVFSNESEAEAYAKKNGLDPTDLSAVALAVAALPGKKNPLRTRTVVFTQGSKSTIVASTSSDGTAVVTEYPVEPLPKEQLVDTNGAGDAFVGGFLSQLVQGKDLAACVRAGHYAARHIIQVSGTTLDVPSAYQPIEE